MTKKLVTAETHNHLVGVGYHAFVPLAQQDMGSLRLSLEQPTSNRQVIGSNPIGNTKETHAHQSVMCAGKFAHDRKSDADKQAKNFKRRDGNARSRLKVALQSYRCKFCGKWHVGKPQMNRIHRKP